VPTLERRLRLRPEARDDIERAKRDSLNRVKFGLMTSIEATSAFSEFLARIVRDEKAWIVDERDHRGVKCRKCGHEQAVPTDTSFYSCRCSPNVKRAAHVDMVDVDDRYMVNPDALPGGV
jgi:hypothetical protein